MAPIRRPRTEARMPLVRLSRFRMAITTRENTYRAKNSVGPNWMANWPMGMVRKISRMEGRVASRFQPM